MRDIFFVILFFLGKRVVGKSAPVFLAVARPSVGIFLENLSCLCLSLFLLPFWNHSMKIEPTNGPNCHFWIFQQSNNRVLLDASFLPPKDGCSSPFSWLFYKVLLEAIESRERTGEEGRQHFFKVGSARDLALRRRQIKQIREAEWPFSNHPTNRDCCFEKEPMPSFPNRWLLAPLSTESFQPIASISSRTCSQKKVGTRSQAPKSREWPSPTFPALFTGKLIVAPWNT